MLVAESTIKNKAVIRRASLKTKFKPQNIQPKLL